MDYCYEAGRRIVSDPDDEDLGEPACDGDCDFCDDGPHSGPIVAKMVFDVKQDSIWMEGTAGPGISSGSQFGIVETRGLGASARERIQVIAQREVEWLKNFYPERSVRFEIVVRGLQQQTTLEAL